MSRVYIDLEFEDVEEGLTNVVVFAKKSYYDHYKNFFKKLGFTTKSDEAHKLILSTREEWYENMVKYLNKLINKAGGDKPFIKTNDMFKAIGNMPIDNVTKLTDRLSVEIDDDNNMYILSQEKEGIYNFYRELLADMGFEVGKDEAVKSVPDKDQRDIIIKVVRYINKLNKDVFTRPVISINEIMSTYPDLEVPDTDQILDVHMWTKYISVVMDINILEPKNDVQYYLKVEGVKKTCTFVQLKSTPDKVPYRLDIKDEDDVVYRCYRNVNKFYYKEEEVIYKR